MSDPISFQSSHSALSSVYEHSCKVAINFVKQYYTMLHSDSSQLHRFYVSQSALVHGGNDEDKSCPALGQKEIQDKVDSLGLTDVHTSIKQIDALPSGGNSILIQVTGELSARGSAMRAFVQSFVLSQDGPKKYSIVADIFRYQEDGECPEGLEEVSYPVDEQIETVPSPENGNLASQEDLLSSQPPLGPEEGTIEVPCVPVGSQPIILPDSPINDWTMDADESYEPQNGPVEYPADGTEDNVEQTIQERDEDIEPDHQGPPAGEREPQESGGQRNMSYASISSIHVPPGANKLSEPRFTTRNFAPKKKSGFQVSNPVVGRDARTSGPPMGPYRPKASAEIPNRAPREQFQIFVGGLPKECQSDELLECFSPVATVIDVKVHPNGYGFVAFSSEEQVNRVMEKGTYTIRQNKIRVERKGSSGAKGGYSRDQPPNKKREGQKSGAQARH